MNISFFGTILATKKISYDIMNIMISFLKLFFLNIAGMGNRGSNSLDIINIIRKFKLEVNF